MSILLNVNVNRLKCWTRKSRSLYDEYYDGFDEIYKSFDKDRISEKKEMTDSDESTLIMSRYAKVKPDRIPEITLNLTTIEVRTVVRKLRVVWN